MKECFYCKSELDDSEETCLFCGGLQTKICNQCKKVIPIKNLACPSCGNKFSPQKALIDIIKDDLGQIRKDIHITEKRNEVIILIKNSVKDINFILSFFYWIAIIDIIILIILFLIFIMNPRR